MSNNKNNVSFFNEDEIIDSNRDNKSLNNKKKSSSYKNNPNHPLSNLILSTPTKPTTSSSTPASINGSKIAPSSNQSTRQQQQQLFTNNTNTTGSTIKKQPFNENNNTILSEFPYLQLNNTTIMIPNNEKVVEYNFENIFLNYNNIIIPKNKLSSGGGDGSTSLLMNEMYTPISPSHLKKTKQGGELTVGEIEGQLIHIQSLNDSLISYYCNRGGVIYPNIIIPYNHSTNKYNGIIKNDSNYKSIYDTMCEYLQSITNYIPTYLFNSTNYYSNNYDTFESPGDHVKGVKCHDWHPFLMKIAVTFEDDSIYFYNVINEEWSCQMLTHEFQNRVSTIKWKPIPPPVDKNKSSSGSSTGGDSRGSAGSGSGSSSGKVDPNIYTESILAVGCEKGILIWDVNRRMNLTRRGVCIFIKTPTSVDQLTWSPDGEMLASSSKHDDTIRIYKFVNNDWTQINTITRLNGGIRNCVFLNDEHLLVSHHQTNIFRIYNTNNWSNNQKWSSFNKPIRSLCYNSKYLFLVEQDSDCIHVLKNNGLFKKLDSNVNYCYHSKIPLSQYTNNNVTCCGIINQIVLNHNRLIVSFRDSHLLAVLQVNFRPHFTCTPLGYIRGPSQHLLKDVNPLLHNDLNQHEANLTSPDAISVDSNTTVSSGGGSSSNIFGQALDENSSNGYDLQFWNNFEKGSLLSVVWKGIDKDKLSIYPFYYTPIDDHDKLSMDTKEWNVLFDENNHFYRNRLNKNYERLYNEDNIEQSMVDEDDDSDLNHSNIF